MTISNLITLFRIVISPLFLFIYLYPGFFHLSSTTLPYALIALLGVSEITDALDGFIARRFNQVTELGKLLDPMADSIWRTSVFLTFTYPPIQLPMWIIFLFLFRDSAISTLRTICALKGFTLAARLSGKLKAIFQGAIALFMLILMIPYSNGNLSLESLQFWSANVAFMVALWSLLSAIDYLRATKPYIKKILEN